MFLFNFKTNIINKQANGLYLNEINEFSNNRVSAFLPYEEVCINIYLLKFINL